MTPDVDEIADVVVETIGDVVGPLISRVTELEQRAVVDGRDGLPGLPGRDGRDADTALVTELRSEVVALRAELALVKSTAISAGLNGDTGEPWIQGSHGEKGDVGDAGPIGPMGPTGQKGDQGERGETGERGEPGPEGNSGPQGPAGPQGQPGPSGVDGKDGGSGHDGVDGKDAAPLTSDHILAALQSDPALLEKALSAYLVANPPIAGKDGAKGLDGEEGPEGKPGRDGQPGVPGRWGEKGADGKDGIDGLGFDDVSVVHDGERSFEIVFSRGEKKKSFGPFTIPTVLDRGVFESGRAYQKGDGVTWGGSFWIAQKETNAKPGLPDAESRAWRLAVKKGADGRPGVEGKSGPEGKPGPQGQQGRPGY